MKSFKVFFSAILLGLLCCQVAADKSEPATNLVPVKIIEEPALYLANVNLQNFADPSTRAYLDQMSQLKAKHAAAIFSGPPQLEELFGKCFDFTKQNYKWVVCPFQNVTQFEQSVYKAYKGILGIWRDWKIIDGRFVSMSMTDGDECGAQGSRATIVHLNCNDQNEQTEIQNVDEPSICSYEINMRSPLACERSDLGYTMKVFPVLTSELQIEWNKAFSDFVYKFISGDVYERILRNIYERAGLLYVNGNNAEMEEDPNFDSLTIEELRSRLLKCQKENKDLKNVQAKVPKPEL